MGRRKKVVDVVETPTEMKEDAMNAPVEEEIKDFVEPQTENVVEDVPTVEVPVEKEEEVPYIEPQVSDVKPAVSEPVFKKIQCGASLVNVRAEANGEVLYTIRNLSKIRVEDEVEVDGVKWFKISGYVMGELVKDL